MKIRKLTGILLAAVMASAYVPIYTVEAEAATVGYSSIDALCPGGSFAAYLNQECRGALDRFNVSIVLDAYDYYVNDSQGKTYPVIFTADNIKALASCQENFDVKVEIKLCDFATGTRYSAIVTDEGAYVANKNSTELKEISGTYEGGINLTLDFYKKTEALEVVPYNVTFSKNISFPITYKVGYNSGFGDLLSDCDLLSVVDSNGLGILEKNSGDDIHIFEKLPVGREDLIFTVTNQPDAISKHKEIMNVTDSVSDYGGIVIKKIPDPDKIYAKNESRTADVIKDLLYDYLGFGKSGWVEDIDEYPETKKYINGAVTEIVNGLEYYSTYEDIVDAVEDYCKDNEKELIEVYLKDIDFSDELEAGILEILGANPSKSEEDTLTEYIYKMIADKFADYTVPDGDVISVIKKNIDEIAKSVVDAIVSDPELMEKFKGEDGKSFEDWLKENNYKDAQDFIDSISGEDGKSFEDWLKENNYKNKDEFIEDISSESFEQWLEDNGYKNADDFIEKIGADSFENWLKEQGYRDTTSFLNAMQGKDGQSFEDWLNTEYKGDKNDFMSDIFDAWISQHYGTRESFINSIKGERGEDGESAYDIAVRHGYRGTEQQWIDSLQGANGLSAYELAKQDGYKGTLNEWLDSLHGKDGKDGEDGADGEDGKDGEDGEDGRDGVDGRDGQIVYVNGTYGQVPETGSTDADVILIPSGSTPGAGNVNPATGVAAGVILPAAAIGSVMLVKKQGRKRGRK